MRRNFLKEGKHASKLSSEVINRLLENLKAFLDFTSKEKINHLKLEGSLLETEIKEEKTSLEKKGELSEIDHRKSFYRGIILGTFTLAGLFGESFLVLWTLRAFSVGAEASVIALTIVIAGSLTIEKYLVHIRKVYPNQYEKFMAHTSFVALVAFLITLFLLADIRGNLLQTQTVTYDGSLERQVAQIDNFYQSTCQSMVWLMSLAAIVLALACGICLHESLERIIVSGETLRIYQKIRRMRKRQKSIACQITEWEYLPQKGVKEFEAGILWGFEHKSKDIDFEKYLISPLSAILLAIFLLFLIKGVARGSEESHNEHVIVLFDLSGSSISKDYKGEEEFQKNLKVVPEIIKQLKSTSYFKVIGITESSFSRPYLVIEGKISGEKGLFNEKEARSKLALMNSWNKQDLKPNAKKTDLFGAVSLAANLFSGEDGVIKKLIIVSDMRQCGREFDLEKPPCVDIETITKVREKGLLPSLKGVEVWVLGVHTVGKTEKYWNSLKRFWLSYFKETGANTLSYSIDRRWSYE